MTVQWTQDRGLGTGLELIDLSGTFDQTTLEATQFIPEFTFPIWLLSMQAYGSADVLDGTLARAGGIGAHVYFTRCECYDGNEIDGDGCSALCRVEPCFSCTPEPSIYTPSLDAAACSDGNDCTSGETCNSGVCAGGTEVSSCVNLEGLWHASSQGIGEIEVDIRIQQRNVVFTLFDLSEPGDPL